MWLTDEKPSTKLGTSSETFSSMSGLPKCQQIGIYRSEPRKERPVAKARFRYVESGFWNFDSLFVPQQHPARDLQDTFYVSDPPKADPPRADPDTETVMDQMEAYTNKFANTDKSREVCIMYYHLSLKSARNTTHCFLSLETMTPTSRTSKRFTRTVLSEVLGIGIHGLPTSVYASSSELIRLPSLHGFYTDLRKTRDLQNTSQLTRFSAMRQ